MMTRDRARFAGFSSSELLQRARALRDIAVSDPLEGQRLEQLASEHEAAASIMRRKESAEDAR